MNVALLADGMGWHLHGWAAALGLRFGVDSVYLSDPDGSNTDAVREAVGDPLKAVYDSADALFRERDVEIAIVDSSPKKSPALVEAALSAGVPVIVEKPAATDPDEYARLVDMANSKGLLLAMSLMDGPPVREAARRVSEGQLGRILTIHYMLVDHQRWRIRDRMGWVYSKEEAGGGMLGHEFCHAVHNMQRIVGEDITQVTGFADVRSGEPLEVEDSVFLNVRFRSGVAGAFIGGSWGPAVRDMDAPYDVSKLNLPHGFSVWGEKGAIHVDMSGGRFVMDMQVDGDPRTERPPTPEGDFPRPTGVRRWETLVERPRERGATQALFLQECLDAIRGTGEPPITNEEGLRFLRVQHALYRASETGQLQHLA